MIMRTELEQGVTPDGPAAPTDDLGEGNESGETQRPLPPTTRRVVAFLSAASLAGAGLVFAGVAPRAHRGSELAADAHALTEARRVVTVATPTRDGAAYELRLPGSSVPLKTTVLYARTNGYLKQLHADIGDRVAAGAVLAEIESPETDAQLREARATLEQNRANLVLVTQRLERANKAHQTQAVARGEVDDLTAQRNSAAAGLHVSEAVVTRLESDQSFQKVVAPFDGVVTERNVELGSLVSAGSSAAVTPLFRLEQNAVLKVNVDVPQSAAPSVTVGQPVTVEVREFPGRTFRGEVARTAGSVDPTTRTLRTEVHLPNPKGELFSGVYAMVRLPVQDPRRPVRVPAAALVLDAGGAQVVLVDAEGALRRRPVELGRDFGKEVEVTGGLTGAERLVVNPRDDARDGDVVSVR